MRSAGRTTEGSVDTLFSQYDADELWQNLYALGASPGARHRAVSIGAALAAALRASARKSGIEAKPLPEANELTNHAARAYGITGMHEDYVPLDPTEVATVRVGDELLALIPGLTERPLADLSRAVKMAKEVDHLLVERHGFGLFNIVRVAAKYVDLCVTHLSSSWIPAPTLDLEQKIELSRAELEAVQEFQKVDPLKELDLTQTDSAALEWMSTTKASAAYEHESPTSPFGRFIRFHRNGIDDVDRWVPPAYIPEIMAHAVNELLGMSPNDRTLTAALRTCHWEEAERALWGFANQLFHSPALNEGDQPRLGAEVDWLLPVNDTTLIAISAVYADDIRGQEPPEPGCLRLARQTRKEETPVAVMTGDKELRLATGLEIVPLVLVMGNSHMVVPQQPGVAAMSLEDLSWISYTATDKSDLYHFIKEFASLNGSTMIGFEIINYWEVWRENGKSFHRGGLTPSFMVFAPHAGDAEWERAVELSELEIGLFGTGLPALRDTQSAEITSGGIASVSVLEGRSQYVKKSGIRHAPKLSGWSLTLIRPTVAIRRANPEWASPEEFNFLYDVCGGLVFAFLGLKEDWQRAHSDSGVSGYKIELAIVEMAEETSDPTVINKISASIDRAQEVVAADWAFDLDKFVEATDGRPSAANHVTGEALPGLFETIGLEKETVEQLIHRWKNSKPFLILETQTAVTHLHGLSQPWSINETDESVNVIAFGKRLYAANVEPGDYRGLEANQLLRDHLAPVALAQLHSLIQLYERDDIILTGLEQLNRVIDSSTRQEGELSRVSANLETEWDPNARLTEVAQESLQLRQSNETIIEAALYAESNEREPHRSINEQSWSGLLAAADAYRTITLLSEQLHYRVVPITLQITSTYELRFNESETPLDGFWNLRGETMNQTASHLKLANVDETQDADDDVLEDRTLAEAMLEVFGAAPVDLFGTLLAVVQWKSFGSGLTTDRITETELINWICSYTGRGDAEQRSRYQKAVRLLTLSSKKIRSSDWSPWKTRTRRHRLLVEPFVLRSDGTLHIAPHYAMASGNVYRNYLAQGMLPWSNPAPKKLETALARRRATRNKTFETDLEQAVIDRGFRTLSRVKVGDYARLGIPELSTEIDLVCGIPGRPEIWLLEAKDPASVHGYSEVDRQLSNFFRDSKRKGRIKPCYASQLARKDAEVRPYLDRVAEKLGLGKVTTGGARELRTLFITRNLIPAGFVDEAYKVRSLSEFLSWLDSEYLNE